MKKKALLLSCLCIFGLCIGKTYAIDTKKAPIIETEKADPPHGYEEIELLGTLMYGINTNAIIAGASNDAIYIQFNQTFGNVNISIYNSIGGLVYSTVVNTDVQQVVIIPFTNAASGTYTVELNNANGYADGDFEHN